MKKLVFKILLSLLLIIPFILQAQEDQSNVKERRITVTEYRSKMKAGWIGQMVGVGWGAPTEFRYLSKIIPADEVPEWNPEKVNVFGRDVHFRICNVRQRR